MASAQVRFGKWRALSSNGKYFGTIGKESELSKIEADRIADEWEKN